MLTIPATLDAVLSMPRETPIACQVCKHEAPLTFAGTVKRADSGRLEIFSGKTHQSMSFAVPDDFRGVQSSDGVIKNAELARVKPGLLSRVTYRTVGGHHVPSEILLLTIQQCRSLQAAEALSRSRPATASPCPD
jgi:hypothetical protein